MAPYDSTGFKDDLYGDEPDELEVAIEQEAEEMSLAQSLQTVFSMFRAPQS